uniref:Uncharacterized protein n=1 Tax=Laticauda laticaudata TaxID=8630 RepID=A0A8C5STT6_LATLA
RTAYYPSLRRYSPAPSPSYYLIQGIPAHFPTAILTHPTSICQALNLFKGAWKVMGVESLGRAQLTFT